MSGSSDKFYETGTRFDFGGGRTGPDMMVSDLEDLTSRHFNEGSQMIKKWLMDKIQSRNNLPNVMHPSGTNPDRQVQNTISIWKLFGGNRGGGSAPPTPG
jgi:hypothetical protein